MIRLSRARALLLALFALLLGSCASGPEAWEPSWSGPYADLPVAERLEFARAREDLELGQLESARVRLVRLRKDYPDQLDVGVLLQDVELAILEARTGEGTLAPSADPLGALEKRYADLSDASVSVVSLVLAARAAEDPLVSTGYLDRAREIDPGCAWAHYGFAHGRLLQRSQYRWSQSKEALGRALAADPSHIGARRLEAWMFSQEGAATEASQALERWLIVTEGDPRVSSERRTRARIDLALVWILDGRVDAARQELGALTGDPVDRSRRLAVLAVAEQEGGNIAAALDAARRAHLADGKSLLPLVQEALMQQYWAGDLEAAAAKWEAVARASEGSGDLGSLLQGFRARVALERMDQEAGLGSQAVPSP